MPEKQSDIFAVVEIFGHKTIAGRVTKDTGLFPLLRIDVPETSDWPAYTAEFGPAAIFSIVYVSEEVARSAAEALKVKPLNVYSPDLITKDQYEEMKQRYEQRLSSLQLGQGADRRDYSDDEEEDS